MIYFAHFVEKKALVATSFIALCKYEETYDKFNQTNVPPFLCVFVLCVLNQ